STGGDGAGGLGGGLGTELKAAELLLTDFTSDGTFNIQRLTLNDVEYSKAADPTPSSTSGQATFYLGGTVAMNNDDFSIGQTQISSTVPTLLTSNSLVCKNGLQIKNLPGNDIIYIGKSDVTSSVGYP